VLFSKKYASGRAIKEFQFDLLLIIIKGLCILAFNVAQNFGYNWMMLKSADEVQDIISFQARRSSSPRQ